MTRIAFFGHNAADAAVRRRARAFLADGFAVVGYMMRRGEPVPTEWANVDLGRTYDAAMGQRLKSIIAGAGLAAIDPGLADADLIYARNLDMLACAFLAKRRARLQTPVVYECLDVHRLTTRSDPVGLAMRALERSLLRRCAALVVSSPGFLAHHFERRHAGLYKPFLVENRLPEGAFIGDRPALAPLGTSQPLRLGWIGNLRCRRSFELLCGLADLFPGRLEVRLHGRPARTEVPVFESEVEARANMTYAGPYRAAEDLPRIYGGVDLVWAGDFMEAGFNSQWLLPNRLYEGGYFATPPIAPSGTETARWIAERGAGFLLDEPLETELPALIARLLDDRSAVDAARAALLAAPRSRFVEPAGEMRRLIEEILSGATAPGA